jgi:hypothetical protein
MTAEKGFALVPKKTRVDWGAARKMGVALFPHIEDNGLEVEVRFSILLCDRSHG